MPSIMTITRLALLLSAVVSAAAGCSTPNDQTVFDSDTQSHVASWVVPKHAPAAQTDVASCTECHGENLLGGISRVACKTCHLNGMTSLTGCTSCHGNPPAGGIYPDRSGKHTSHNALNGVKNVCDTCHSGAGLHTQKHANGTVDLLIAYNAKSGAAVANADGTCSGVSCHGGKTTPAWLTGTIDINVECYSCHAFGTSEYNSYVSGQHAKHVNELNFPCTRCHATAQLAGSHFTSLNTATMEGPASATLNSSLSYTGGSCTPLCHGTEAW